MRENYLQGAGFMVLAGASTAAFGFFAKVGTAETDLPHAVFLRFFLPLILFVGPYLCIQALWRNVQFSRPFQLRVLMWPLLRAAVLVLGQSGFFFYLSYGTIVDAILLWNTAPLFIPLLEKLCFNQHITRRVWLCLTVAFFGVTLVIKPSEGLLDPVALVGLMSGLCMAISQLILNHMAKRFSLLENLLHVYVLTSLFALVVVSWSTHFQFNGYFIELLTTVSLLPFFIGMAVASLGNQIFRMLAYRRVHNTASLAPVMYLAIVFSALIDWAIYHRLPDHLTISGAILIIGPALLLSFSHKRLGRVINKGQVTPPSLNS